MSDDVERVARDYERLVAERRAQDMALDAAIQSGCGDATREYLAVRVEQADRTLDRLLRRIRRLDPRRPIVGHRTV